MIGQKKCKQTFRLAKFQNLLNDSNVCVIDFTKIERKHRTINFVVVVMMTGQARFKLLSTVS